MRQKLAQLLATRGVVFPSINVFGWLVPLVCLFALAACSDQFSRPLPALAVRPTLVQPLYYTAAPRMPFIEQGGKRYTRLTAPQQGQLRFYYQGDSVTVPQDSVWGIRTGSGELQRFHNRQTLLVVELDTIVVYNAQGHTAEAPQIYGVGATATAANEPSYYFSRGLGGPVLPLERAMVKAQFANDDAFLNEVKRMNWYNSLSDYSSKHRMYRINYLYRQAHPKAAFSSRLSQ